MFGLEMLQQSVPYPKNEGKLSTIIIESRNTLRDNVLMQSLIFFAFLFVGKWIFPSFESYTLRN